eukprot:2422828-Pleurochrysis_carterae.AAC.2
MTATFRVWRESASAPPVGLTEEVESAAPRKGRYAAHLSSAPSTWHLDRKLLDFSEDKDRLHCLLCCAMFTSVNTIDVDRRSDVGGPVHSLFQPHEECTSQ